MIKLNTMKILFVLILLVFPIAALRSKDKNKVCVNKADVSIT